MTEAFVSSNGSKVFIAGYNSDDFIIGRYDSTGTLGISSCYKPTDINGKMNGARVGFMWSVR